MRNSKGQFIKGITPWNKGKVLNYSPETIEKMTVGLKLGSFKGHPFWGGEKGWFKKGHSIIGGAHSMPHSKETIEKLKIINKAKAKSGKDAWNWKGDEVGYYALYHWINRILGRPDTCEDCGSSGLKGHKIHWSNISGEYKRNTEDWQRLCAKCHKAFDKNRALII